MGQSSMIPQIYGTEAYQTACEMCEKTGEVMGSLLAWKVDRWADCPIQVPTF
jgi:hypothetical protein